MLIQMRCNFFLCNLKDCPAKTKVGFKWYNKNSAFLKEQPLRIRFQCYVTTILICGKTIQLKLRKEYSNYQDYFKKCCQPSAARFKILVCKDYSVFIKIQTQAVKRYKHAEILQFSF